MVVCCQGRIGWKQKLAGWSLEWLGTRKVEGVHNDVLELRFVRSKTVGAKEIRERQRQRVGQGTWLPGIGARGSKPGRPAEASAGPPMGNVSQ